MISQKVRDQAVRLRRELGLVGTIALALLAATAIFHKVALEPMQARAQVLSSELARHSGQIATPGGGAGNAAKLETFYSYMGHGESKTDWLAKLYAIGKATGVELQSANYRTQPAAEGQSGKIERYEIVLPVSGSYLQMRDFLKRALVEIPVLSLDQMNLKRENRNDGAVQAELKMTLHLVKQ